MARSVSVLHHIDLLATASAEVAKHYLALPVALPTPPVFAGPEVPNVADQHLMEIDGWADALARQCAGLRDELILLAPWLAAPKSETSGVALVAEGSGVITLRALAALDETSDGEPHDSPRCAHKA